MPPLHIQKTTAAFRQQPPPPFSPSHPNNRRHDIASRFGGVFVYVCTTCKSLVPPRFIIFTETMRKRVVTFTVLRGNLRESTKVK
ncbi:transmembrane protein, putative [Medicago truncatula]|uniref:Transmembrane protein, putative n=1 Tax=Medicago truncatula TaxID=3880 RepID=G7JKS2_MEDTR|nr:transmembrane protein, putative [Medicago truncatula]